MGRSHFPPAFCSGDNPPAFVSGSLGSWSTKAFRTRKVPSIVRATVAIIAKTNRTIARSFWLAHFFAF
jgi:hypothetical protein